MYDKVNPQSDAAEPAQGFPAKPKDAAELVDIIKQRFGTNQNKERDGVFYPIGDGIEFKVKRLTDRNKDYTKVMARLGRPFRNTPDGAPPHVVLSMSRRAFCEVILVDWRGVLEFRKGTNPATNLPFATGQPMECNLENKLYMMKTYPDLYNLISTAAALPETFKDGEVEVDADDYGFDDPNMSFDDDTDHSAEGN